MPGSPRKRERREKAAGVEGQVVDGAAKPARARTQIVRREAEPYLPGNKAAVTHGAYSLDLVNKTAEEVWDVVEELLRALPGWRDADQLVVAEFRYVTATLTQLRKRTAELGGPLDEKHQPRSYWPLETKTAAHWLKLAESLGLGAAARAKVFGNLGQAERDHMQAMQAQQRLQERDQARKKRR